MAQRGVRLAERRFGLPDGASIPSVTSCRSTARARGCSWRPSSSRPETKAGARPAILLPNPFYQCYAAAILAAAPSRSSCPPPPRPASCPPSTGCPNEVLTRTVAAYICSPSNPEGAVADEEYWRTLFALADRHDFTVFADECYADIYRDTPPVGALTARYARPAASHGC